LVHSLVKEWRAQQDLRRRTEELGRSERSLSITLDSLADGVIGTDRLGRVNRMNAAAQQLTGWTLVEAAGRAVDEVFVLREEAPGDAIPNLLARVEPVEGHLEFADTAALQTRGGDWLPIAAKASPIRYDRDLIGLVVVFRDASAERERRQLLEARVVDRTRSLDEANEDLITANQAHASLIASRTREEIAETVVRLLVEQFHVGFARLWVACQGDRCRLECVRRADAPGGAPCLHGISRSAEPTVSTGMEGRESAIAPDISQIWRSGQRMVRFDPPPDVYVDDPDKAASLGRGVFVGIPLLHEGSTLGVLSVFTPAMLSPHRLKVVELLAGSAAEALVNVGHLDAISRSRETLSAIFEAMPVGIVVMDSQRRIREANRVALRLTGCETEDELVGAAGDEYLRPLRSAEAGVDGNGADTATEWRLHSRAGRELPVLARIAPVILDGEEVWLAAIIDITRMKEAERAAEALRLQQQAILDNIPDAAWLKSQGGTYLMVNAAFAALCGRTAAEVAGREDTAIWPRELATFQLTADATEQDGDAQVHAYGAQGHRIAAVGIWRLDNQLLSCHERHGGASPQGKLAVNRPHGEGQAGQDQQPPERQVEGLGKQRRPPQPAVKPRPQPDDKTGQRQQEYRRQGQQRHKALPGIVFMPGLFKQFILHRSHPWSILILSPQRQK